MRYVNILHISDLHLKPEGGVERYNQTLVIDGLKKALSDLVESQYQPDLIVFSGDLVNAADDNIFGDVRTIIEEIAQAANLNLSNIIICPGNHDASRNAIGPAIPAIQNFRDQARKVNGANQLNFESRFVAHVGNVFGSVNSLYRHFGPVDQPFSDFLTRSYLLPRLGIGIVTTNTASLSGAGLTKDLEDERNLFASEISVDKALKAIPDGLVKIVIGHHPLNFLNENNEIIFKTLLQKEASLYLSGHLHRAAPEFTASPQGETFYIQAGSLYAARPWWNGFSIISVDPANPTKQRVLYKRWHEERRAFGLATEFSDDGLVYNNDASKHYWSSVKPRISPRTWETWRLNNLIPSVAEECSKDLSRVFEEKRFIEPDFEKDRYVKTNEGIEKAAQPVKVTFEELVNGQQNLVIMASSESGKTTLIREWVRRVANNSAMDSNWQIPVIVRFDELRSYLNYIERLISQRLPKLPEGVTAVDLIESGKILLLVDDVKLAQLQDNGGLASFIKKYFKNRYILLTGSVYLQGAGIAPVIVKGVEFEHVRSKHLRTSQVLALIESHGMTDPAKADRLLQRMMVEANSLNVPITPVTGSFLIQIYTEDSATSLVNKANLIERYVEISLEKFAPAELLPSSFDFRNKTDLLSYIAEKMARLEVYFASEADFVAWVNEYLAEFGLRFSTLDLIEYFVQARILERNDGTISFRLNAFFEYFAAVRMSEDRDFRGYVLSRENYLRFPNEISFYAAISRKDIEWLDELVSRFKEHAGQVKSGAGETISASFILENFELPKSDASIEKLKEIENRVFDKALSEEDRREALDDDIPPSDIETRPTQRPQAPDVGATWISQLTMLSAMLKNMELVSTAKKTEILKIVIEAWLEFIAMSMRMVPMLAEQRHLKFAGVEYVVLYPDDMDAGELAQRLYMYMPVSTSKLVNYHLGTEKLRVQLEGGIGPSSTESPASQFLRGAILAQLGVDGLPEILERVATSIGGKRYLQEVFFRLLAEVVVRYRLPDKERQRIKSVAADVRVALEGKTGSAATRRRGSVMSALDSTRLKVQYSNKKSERLPKPK